MTDKALLSEVMKRAHRLASHEKEIAELTGNGEQPLFSECLKEAWKEALCCPCCGRKHNAVSTTIMMYCGECKAVFTPLYKKVSFAYSTNFVETEMESGEDWGNYRYFDIALVNNERRHGWYNPQTRNIVQVG
ncbi:MAG: hypothetical protein GTN82_15585 [Candidatus Aminicenantes bacterium]|nr:hypothetical protein [Candidatus Aminicenantes bacterium]